MINKALYSSKSDEWSTPAGLMHHLTLKFGEMFDPCPVGHTFDGLLIEWKERNYVNPPYSQISAWVQKAYSEYLNGKFVCLLIPARTDTKYFHKFLIRCQSIYFIEGRLKFGNSTNSAPFPSMICIFDPSIKTDYPHIRTINKG